MEGAQRPVPFPNLAGKHAYDAFFSPQEAIADLQRHGLWETFPLPASVIFLSSLKLLERTLARWPGAEGTAQGHDRDRRPRYTAKMYRHRGGLRIGRRPHLRAPQSSAFCHRSRLRSDHSPLLRQGN